MTRVLVIAAHSDDEALGCGGTLAAHASHGHEVHVVFLTNGVGARGAESDRRAATQRRIASEAAARAMGIKEIVQLDFPDNRMDTVALLDIVQSIEQVVLRISPHIIYTHHANDLNIDHRICHQAVLTACHPQPGHPVRAIYGFEVASSTEWSFGQLGFQPNHFVNISSHLECKLNALSCYAAEMRPTPHARSIEAVTALARWRGAIIGCHAAEGFEVIRQIAEVH